MSSVDPNSNVVATTECPICTDDYPLTQCVAAPCCGKWVCNGCVTASHLKAFVSFEAEGPVKCCYCHQLVEGADAYSGIMSVQDVELLRARLESAKKKADEVDPLTMAWTATFLCPHCQTPLSAGFDACDLVLCSNYDCNQAVHVLDPSCTTHTFILRDFGASLAKFDGEDAVMMVMLDGNMCMAWKAMRLNEAVVMLLEAAMSGNKAAAEKILNQVSLAGLPGLDGLLTLLYESVNANAEFYGTVGICSTFSTLVKFLGSTKCDDIVILQELQKEADGGMPSFESMEWVLKIADPVLKWWLVMHFVMNDEAFWTGSSSSSSSSSNPTLTDDALTDGNTNYAIVTVPGGGNCLFEVLLLDDTLQVNSDNAADLRQEIAQLIRGLAIDNADAIADAIAEVDSYVDTMHLDAIARAVNRRLVLYEAHWGATSTHAKTTHGDDAAQEIGLLLRSLGKGAPLEAQAQGHYDALR